MARAVRPGPACSYRRRHAGRRGAAEANAPTAVTAGASEPAGAAVAVTGASRPARRWRGDPPGGAAGRPAQQLREVGAGHNSTALFMTPGEQRHRWCRPPPRCSTPGPDSDRRAADRADRGPLAAARPGADAAAEPDAARGRDPWSATLLFGLAPRAASWNASRTGRCDAEPRWPAAEPRSRRPARATSSAGVARVLFAGAARRLHRLPAHARRQAVARDHAMTIVRSSLEPRVGTAVGQNSHLRRARTPNGKRPFIPPLSATQIPVSTLPDTRPGTTHLTTTTTTTGHRRLPAMPVRLEGTDAVRDRARRPGAGGLDKLIDNAVDWPSSTIRLRRGIDAAQVRDRGQTTDPPLPPAAGNACSKVALAASPRRRRRRAAFRPGSLHSPADCRLPAAAPRRKTSPRPRGGVRFAVRLAQPAGIVTAVATRETSQSRTEVVYDPVTGLGGRR